MKKVAIVSGKIRSGKSTALLKWSETLSNAGGILQLVEGNRRILLNVATKEKRMLETDDCSQEDAVRIGFYCFRKSVFEWGRNVLFAAADKQKSPLIIDEIGKLELKERGLEPAVTEVLRFKEKSNSRIILVVRDFLLKEVIDKYGLSADDFDHLDIRELQ